MIPSGLEAGEETAFHQSQARLVATVTLYPPGILKRTSRFLSESELAERLMLAHLSSALGAVL